MPTIPAKGNKYNINTHKHPFSMAIFYV